MSFPLARALGRTFILPAEDAPAAGRVRGVEVFGAPDLASVLHHLRGEVPLGAPTAQPQRAARVDLADVRGQAVARRALEIAAAGAHHVLLLGPPGCGKSLSEGRRGASRGCRGASSSFGRNWTIEGDRL
jgi:magnesium chelatase family protein